MPRTPLSLLCGIVVSGLASAAPAPEATEVLGPFVGFDAQLHPDNRQPQLIAYGGTDLGWSYQHGGKIHFLFGDTHAGERATPSARYTTTRSAPSISPTGPTRPGSRAATYPSSSSDRITGQARLQGSIRAGRWNSLKTPLGGFSNGTREFGLFITGKPQGCSKAADCSKGYTCDATVGFFGEAPDKQPGLTLPCSDNAPGCTRDAVFDAAGAPVPVAASAPIGPARSGPAPISAASARTRSANSSAFAA